VVIDTNVLVSAAYSNGSFPEQIFNLVQSGNIIPVYDARMLLEYNEVMHRGKFKKDFTEQDIQSILALVVQNGIYISDVEHTKEEFVDKKDIPFFEVKESSGDVGSTLVTGNRKHYPKDDQQIFTPKELLWMLGQMELFVHFDLNYEQSVERVLATNLEKPKYTSGKELLDDLLKNSPDGTLQFSILEEGNDGPER
jgi:putative PIN family toxin of toxin-antitoxin system